jgi:hypothetical protein
VTWRQVVVMTVVVREHIRSLSNMYYLVKTNKKTKKNLPRARDANLEPRSAFVVWVVVVVVVKWRRVLRQLKIC